MNLGKKWKYCLPPPSYQKVHILNCGLFFSLFGTFLISIGPLTLFSRLALTVEENYCCWLPFTAGRGLQMREDILKCRKRSSKYNKRSSNAGWDCQMQEEILKCMKRSSYIGRDLQTQEEIFKWILIIDLIFVHRSGTNKWLSASVLCVQKNVLATFRKGRRLKIGMLTVLINTASTKVLRLDGHHIQRC